MEGGQRETEIKRELDELERSLDIFNNGFTSICQRLESSVCRPSSPVEVCPDKMANESPSTPYGIQLRRISDGIRQLNRLSTDIRDRLEV